MTVPECGIAALEECKFRTRWRWTTFFPSIAVIIYVTEDALEDRTNLTLQVNLRSLLSLDFLLATRLMKL